jgi:hypothetical protein
MQPSGTAGCKLDQNVEKVKISGRVNVRKWKTVQVT